MIEHICGTCKWHHKDQFGDWHCVNSDSEWCTEWTEYTDTCEEWEGKL